MLFKDISIIIPTMNRYNSLKQTINKILKGDVCPTEIIIIDQSNEKEDLKNYLDKLPEQISIVYVEQQEPSLTCARNKGLLLAKNEIVIYSDDDVDVEKDTLSSIYDIFLESNDIVGIGAIDLNSTDKYSILSKCYDILFGTYKPYAKSGYVLKSMIGKYPNKINGRVNTEWMMGYFFAINKTFVIKNNLKWDELLQSYAYPEDLDFSYRLYKKALLENKKIILDENVKVSHLVTKEWRIASRKQSYMYVIHRRYLTYKYFETPIARVLNIWAEIGEIIRRVIKGDNYKDLIKAIIKTNHYNDELKRGIIPKEIWD